MVLGRHYSQILSAGLRISVRVCSVLSMKKKIFMLMKNYDNWKTTEQVSSPAKNPSVLPCSEMIHFGLASSGCMKNLGFVFSSTVLASS